MRQTDQEAFSLKNVKWWVVFGVLLGVCFLTYSNSLHNPFMIDDHRLLSDVKLQNSRFFLNSFIYPTQNLDQGESFSCSGMYYRPMTYVIAMLSYLSFGNEPYGYHVLNLFLFTLMCFTLYVFVDLLFKDKVLALLTGILFAVHPINVFFVNYITSGIHSVRFIFMFLSVIFFIKAWEGGHKYVLYLMGLFCFAVALLCHETSMVLPFYILFVSIFNSKKKASKAAFKAWPYFMMLVLFLSFRFYYTGSNINVYLSGHHDSFDVHRTILVIAAFSKLIYLYFSTLLLPVFVLFSWIVPLMDKFIYIWIIGLLILFVGWGMLLRANAKSIPFFCATWMVLGFLPLLLASLSSNLGLLLEPQWVTFSSIGFYLFIAWGGLKLYARVSKWGMCLVFIFILIGWGSIARYNNWIWGDEIRFIEYWGNNMSSQGKKIHVDDMFIGDAYMDKKNYSLATFYYRRVAHFDRSADRSLAYNNLGLIDMDQGNLKRAQDEFLSSIRDDPGSSIPLINLAIIYTNQSDYKSAISLLLHALELDKYSIEIRLNLAFIYEKELNHKEAVRYYKENLNIVPYEERSLMALTQIYARLHDLKDVRNYSQMLILHNHDAAILTGLGSILAEFGQFPLASDAFSQAMRVDPQYKQAYLEAGKLLANAHMYSEAISLWQMGAEIDPKDQRFKDNIFKAMTLKGSKI